MLGWSKLCSVTVGQFGPQMHVGHVGQTSRSEEAIHYS